jgi:CDP-diacylglycerol--serine O-phosphatidyltransferase
MKIKNHIPNFITLLNLFCGCLAIVAAFKFDLIIASYLVFIGAFFDYIDGTAARLLKAKSDMGKELDSLADVVTFGVVPSIIVYQLLIKNITDSVFFSDYSFLVYFPFIIALFSAIRLAKFNIDSRQTISFLGLPTPANAIFWASAPIIIYYNEHLTPSTFSVFHSFLSDIFQNPYILLILSLLLSLLLIIEIPLFSLKFTNFKWKTNIIRYLFLFVSIILILLFNVAALPIVIVLYIIFSIIHQYFL